MKKYDIINREFVNEPIFQEACKIAGIEPTTRQASKWRNKKGKAYPFRFKSKLKITEGDN